MSGFVKSLGKILPIVLGVAAVVFTAGAALPLTVGALVGTGGFGAALSGVTASLGLDGVLGSVLTGAVTSAGFGAAGGALLSGVTGGDPLKGAESGMVTGAIAGGAMAGLGAITGTAATAANAASNGAAGEANGGGDFIGTGVKSTASTADSLPDVAGNAGTAANGPAGISTGGLTSQVTTDGSMPAYAPASTPQVATNGVAGNSSPALPDVHLPGQVYTGADGVKYTSDGQRWNAPAASPGLFGNGGLLGNGSAGYLLAGVGQGLLGGQDQADKARYDATAAKTALNATQQNYGAATVSNPDGTTTTSGFNGGGLLTPGTPKPGGFQAPQAAFNPTQRWVFDPGTKKLVLTGAAGSPS
jgi:hypothetical protein